MNRDTRLFLGPSGSESKELLRQFVASLKTEDALAPVTVVGPSTYANLSLRHYLGRFGFANVRFFVPPRLSELLGAPSLAARGRRPLTSVLESAAVRAVATMAPEIAMSSANARPSVDSWSGALIISFVTESPIPAPAPCQRSSASLDTFSRRVQRPPSCRIFQSAAGPGNHRPTH